MLIYIRRYSLDDLSKIVTDCYSEVKQSQPLLFKKEANINERAISGEFSSALRNHFTGLHVNCEYNRMVDEHGQLIPKRIKLDPDTATSSRVFPDIIVHRQEDALHNILIIEIKMSWKNSDRDWDEEKLKRYVKELKYQHGLYLEIGENQISDIKWF